MNKNINLALVNPVEVTDVQDVQKKIVREGNARIVTKREPI